MYQFPAAASTSTVMVRVTVRSEVIVSLGLNVPPHAHLRAARAALQVVLSLLLTLGGVALVGCYGRFVQTLARRHPRLFQFIGFFLLDALLAFCVYYFL